MTEQELTRIVGLYSGVVFRTAMCFVKNKADADDIMQDVFFKLYTYKKDFESDEHIKAWLIRVSANMSKNLLKSRWYKLTEPIENAENLVFNKGQTDSLLPVIMKLKPKSRHTLYMFYYENYSVKEIAAIMKQSETSVTSQLSRGRSQLKKLLMKEGYYEL